MTEPSTEIVKAPAALANKRLEGGVTAGNSVLAPADWQMLAAIAETVANTEFVPTGLRGNSPKVLACMLYGHALGIQPMIALKEIAVIDGTPSMSSALMVAKVMERGHTIRREEIRDDNGLMTGVIAHGKRGDNGQEDSFTFTLDMARRAGLMSKKNWQNYPEPMLWWRSSSQLCSFLFPDVFMGSPYMPEELGDDTPPAIEATVELLAEGAERNPNVVITNVTDTEEDLSGDLPVEEVLIEITPEEMRAAVSPSAVETVEAAPEQAEPLAAAEAPGGIGIEGFWEYQFAQKVIADPASHNFIDDDDMEQMLAAAQTLVETFEGLEQLRATAAPAASVVKPGTVPELMVKVAEAQQTGDLETLLAMLETERATSRPRVRYIASIEGAIATVRHTLEHEPQVEDESESAEDVPATEGFTPVDPDSQPELEVDAAQAQLDVNETGHRFDPAVPADDLDHAQAVVRLRAVIGYMQQNHPDEKAWQYPGIIAAASNQWRLPIESLDELERHHLVMILSAAPVEAVQAIGLMDGATVEKLAATVPGSNPS